MNPIISMCRDGKAVDTQNSKAAAVINQIRAGRWREQVERIRSDYERAVAAGRNGKEAVGKLKLKLPAVMWNGCFTTRAAGVALPEKLTAHSGLLCADLDDLTAEKLGDSRWKLIANPHVWALFASPTDRGLKVIFRVPASAEQHAASFRAVQRVVRELCAVEIDQACSDLTRLCFVSYDADAYINRSATELPVESLPVKANATKALASVDLNERQRIASALLGEVSWTNGERGYCECPGKARHTGENADRDCEVHLDGAPTIHCFHNSCHPVVEAMNRELRSQIGKAEAPREPASGSVSPTTEEVVGSSDEAVYEELARLSPADYDRRREAAAEKLEIRVSTLDAEVSRRRAPADDGRGAPADFADAEPWPEPVDGAVLLESVVETFDRFMALPPGAADALALWTAHAHVYEAFVHSPRLNLFSPEKGCGKTTLLDVLAVLTPRSLRTESITPAVLFRLVEANRPTLLLDEVDTYLRNSDELRGLLNAGHKRGAKAYRCEGEQHEVRAFNAFAPAVLAGIGALPGTLHDRSVVVPLVRAKPGEVAARFDSRCTEPQIESCRKLARWVADNRSKLEEADPKLPDSAFNRMADNWRPLFAIAEVAGQDWPKRAETAFFALNQADEMEAQGIGSLLLADIAETYQREQTNRLPSTRLVELLAEIDGHPWADFKGGKAITTNQLARQLGRFKIKSKTIRFGTETAKGYHLADFADAFERYLPITPDSKRNTVTTPENIDDSPHSETSHAESLLPFENTGSTNKDGPCDVVTVSDPFTGEEELHV